MTTDLPSRIDPIGESTLNSRFPPRNSSKKEKDFDPGELKEEAMSIAAQENEASWLRS